MKHKQIKDYVPNENHLKRISLYSVRELRMIYLGKLDIAKMCRCAINGAKIKMSL